MAVKKGQSPKPNNEPDDSDVEGAVAAAESSISEFNEFDEQPEEETEQAADQPGEEEEQQIDDSISVPLSRLSPFLRNKAQQAGLKALPLKEVLQSTFEADEAIQKRGQDANAAREEMRIMRTYVNALAQQLQTLREAPAREAQPRRVDYAEDVNPDNLILEDPRRFGRETASLGARMVREELQPKVLTLEQRLAETNQRLDLNDTRNAAERARVELGVSPEDWEADGPFIYARAAALSTNAPGGLGNKEVWKQSWRELDDRLKARLPKEAAPRAAVPAGEGITRGNPSGSSRPAPAGGRVVARRAPSAVLSFIEEEAVRAGVPKDAARAATEQAAARLNKRSNQ